MPTTINLEGLALDAGGHILIEHALASLDVGTRLIVAGRAPGLPVHLGAWCRSGGHRFEQDGSELNVIKGQATTQRWTDAQRAGEAQRPAAHAERSWGLAARGALVEAGGPALSVDWVDRDAVWTDIAPQLYASAAADQWDPAQAVRWNDDSAIAPLLEDAVVQTMTYLVENEQAALMLPARLLARLHPQFREVMQLLATQIADEARHVEVFTRRALLHRGAMGTSAVSGRVSLQTLIGEPDFTLASFLLSVLGEGTFLDLLRFLNRHAPDPVTADVTALAGRDEARHVAFGASHTAHMVTTDPSYLSRLRAAVERRHDSLVDTAGLNQAVLDSLIILAAGSLDPLAIDRGWQAVQQLKADMDAGRRRRLAFIGFPDDEAAELSALHTRNFM